MRRLITALLLLAALPLWAADVYRSTDENGNVVYTDRPTPGAELVNVQAPYLGGGPATRQRLAASASEPAAAEGQDTAQAGQSAPTAAQQAELRARNCEAARARQQTYVSSRRLYRETESGEREYLSSAEIDEARAQAAADVEQWCS